MSIHPTPAYCAPWWLPGAHLQTIWPLARKGAAFRYYRERRDTPDGDFIDLDWTSAPPAAAGNTPLVVLFHGLEGSSQSHYARALMRAVSAAGWLGVVPHFRGCSGEPNRLARAYHSGDSDEIDWILHDLHQRFAHRPLFAAGVSLGGNALLKWLGERGLAAAERLDGAAAICPPLDLALSGHALAKGFNRLYTRHFLATLKHKALSKAARHPGLCDPQRVSAARSLYEFDDAFTGPVHGFDGASDYWQRASSKPWLRHIRVPTLLLCAANDPFVPGAALPTAGDLPDSVRFECTAGGGHVGFLTAPWPGRLDWLPQRLLAHFHAVTTRAPSESQTGTTPLAY